MEQTGYVSITKIWQWSSHTSIPCRSWNIMLKAYKCPCQNRWILYKNMIVPEERFIQYMCTAQYTWSTIDKCWTCLTLELDAARTSPTRSTRSFVSIFSTWCLRSIDAKGAPIHLGSTLSDCIMITETLAVWGWEYHQASH